MGTDTAPQTEAEKLVKPCVSASCYGRFRVAGLEYDTGGCLTYEGALAIAERAIEMGGVDEWRKRHAIFLDGTPKPRRS
jgi:hypothetical protein